MGSTIVTKVPAQNNTLLPPRKGNVAYVLTDMRMPFSRQDAHINTSNGVMHWCATSARREDAKRCAQVGFARGASTTTEKVVAFLSMIGVLGTAEITPASHTDLRLWACALGQQFKQMNATVLNATNEATARKKVWTEKRLSTPGDWINVNTDFATPDNPSLQHMLGDCQLEESSLQASTM